MADLRIPKTRRNRIRPRSPRAFIGGGAVVSLSGYTSSRYLPTAGAGDRPHHPERERQGAASRCSQQETQRLDAAIQTWA